MTAGGKTMETYSYHRKLPSCLLNRSLLVEIEKKLLFGIPKIMQHGLRKTLQGLGLENHKKLENYSIIVETKKETRTLKCAKELSNSYFEPRTGQVSVVYKLGAPRIITIEIIFQKNNRPLINMTTQSPQVEKMLAKIADGLCASIATYGNYHRILHNSFVQSVMLLTLPTMVMTYGFYRGLDFFLLYTSMGWLCLLSLGLIKSLPHIFPWVTFEAQHRFQLSRLPLLAKVSLLTVAVGCYIGLVLLVLPRASEPNLVMLAGFVG
jgi:hypothetical protein